MTLTLLVRGVSHCKECLDEPWIVVMVKWKVGFVVYCGLVLYLSSMTSGDLPEGPRIENLDKIVHFLEYALMGCLGWAGFAKTGNGFPWGLLAFCACFGIADECWQDWLANARTPDVWDAATDAAGSFAGLVLCQVFWKR